MSNRLVIGLTGGIGSGKSTVAKLFVQKGIDLIDADQIARDVVKPNMPATLAIAEHFGNDVLLEDGNLDRNALRQQVFSDKQAKTWLDNLLHPLIRKTMQNAIKASTSPYCIVDVPLLTENKMQGMFDRVLVVDCSEQNQLLRAIARDGSSEETIRNIIHMQASREQRLHIADDVIENNGTVLDLSEAVDELHKTYLSLLATKI